MYDYLKRNLEFLAELKPIITKINEGSQIIGESSHNKFVYLRTFKSEVAKQQIYVGLKLSKEEYFEDKFYNALTNIAFLYEKNPKIADKLPLFYGLLLNQKNEPQAIITEDFSMNNKFKVEEYVSYKYKPNFIPYSLDDFFSSCKNDLERTIFLVGVERKIGDLDHVRPKREYMKEWINLRYKRILSEKHVISLE
jgi:hypothetical protein